LVSYHPHLKGLTLFGSPDKLAGFEKPLSICFFVTQERGFSNAMDKILLKNIPHSPRYPTPHDNSGGPVYHNIQPLFCKFNPAKSEFLSLV
jgi:hypothetical protein